MSNSGQDFSVDPNIAQPLVNACETLISDYRSLVLEARQLTGMGGFGTLASGLALQKKFQDKAFGGSDSLVNALESHIVAVEDMRAHFQKCIENAQLQEQANAEALRGASLPN